jgi:hypothetical protein
MAGTQEVTEDIMNPKIPQNFSSSGPMELTPEELAKVPDALGTAKKIELYRNMKAVAKDITYLSQEVAGLRASLQDLVNQDNESFAQFTEAHNGVTDLVQTLRLHLWFLLEKVGAIGADGLPTEEFKAWEASKVEEINRLKEEAKARGEWTEPEAQQPTVQAPPDTNVN